MENKREEILKFFEKLRFEDTSHTYEVEGYPLTSVSNMIKRFTEKTDFKKIAAIMAKKEGISVEELQARWDLKRDNACALGHSVHAYGETFMYTKALPSNGFEEAIVNFWSSLPSYIVPCTFELKMYSRELGIAGTSDIILYNTLTEKFIIADYKTNESLTKNYKGKTLLAPFTDLLDSPLGKYEIQLSAYQILFEQTGFEVEDRMIIWLRPDSTFSLFHTGDYTIELQKALKNKI